LKMSNALGNNSTDRWQHSMGKRTCLIRLKINSQNDYWWTEHELGNCLFEIDWRIGMRKNCAKIVPRNLTKYQWDAQMSVCADLLPQVEANPELIDWVITGDKSWFFSIWSRDQTSKFEMVFKATTMPKISTHV
jgi:hypothetical protein